MSSPFDWLFGSSNNTAPGQPTATPQYPPVPSALTGDPSAQDYSNKFVAAARAQELAHPTSLLSWLSGSGRDAATAQAQIGAPDAYFKMLQGKNEAEGGAIGNAQDLAYINRTLAAYGHAPVDPRNVFGTIGNLSLAHPTAGTPGAPLLPNPTPLSGGPAMPPQQPGAPMPSPQTSAPAPMGGNPANNARSMYSSMAQSMVGPQSVAPQPAPMPLQPMAPMPNAAVAQSGNPADAMRSMYAGIAQSMIGLPKYGPLMSEYNKLTQTGLPEGTLGILGGPAVDAITGQPINQTVGQLAAQRAGQVTTTNAAVTQPNILAAQTHQGGIEASNTAARLSQENQNKAAEQMRTQQGDFHNVMGKDGLMHPVSAWDLQRGTPGGGAPASGEAAAAAPSTGFADPETHGAQIKEIGEAQTTGNEASKNQFQVNLLGNALSNVYHGTGGETMLDVAKALNSMGWLDNTGQAKLASGELAKMTGAEVAGVAAKMIGAGRVPLGLFMYMSKAKPGLLSGKPELALAALSQDLQRSQDLADFTSSYYGTPGNAGKLDAAAQFKKQYPLSMYESRVVPLPKPDNKNDLKPGYVYKMNRGPAAWNGTQLVPYSAGGAQ